MKSTRTCFYKTIILHTHTLSFIQPDVSRPNTKLTAQCTLREKHTRGYLRTLIEVNDKTADQSLIEKMNSERGHVSDIIRQEFADRIVTTDEENKRTKHEISELRARHRIELEKAHSALDELRKANEEEMEKVHQRVKQAIVKKEEVVAQLKQQYQAANKRADHLEGLLEQQRKQLLKQK